MALTEIIIIAALGAGVYFLSAGGGLSAISGITDAGGEGISSILTSSSSLLVSGISGVENLGHQLFDKGGTVDSASDVVSGLATQEATKAGETISKLGSAISTIKPPVIQIAKPTFRLF